MNATGSAGIPLPAPNISLLLEDGIAVSFGSPQNSFASGEFWTITARAADGSFETLKNVPPAGIRHHYCRLAIVDFTASPPSVTDCRRVFPTLANPCLHVTQVLLGAATIKNGSRVSIQDLLKSTLTISFDGPLDPAIISPGSGSPICNVTVDLPAAATASGSFSPVILGATVHIGPSPNTLTWNTTATSTAAQTALENLFPPATPFVAHLNLKGCLIWAQGQSSVYLNGAGDGRPSADFQLWFWLTSQPPTTLSATSLLFSTPQLLGASASQTVTLTNNTAGALTITINIGGTNPGDFSQTNTGTMVAANGVCVITVTFKPSAVGTRSAQLNISDSLDPTPQTIDLRGNGVQPAIAATPITSPNAPLTFPQTTVNAVSAQQPVSLTNSGTSQLTITRIDIDPGFVQTSNCLVAGGNLQQGQGCTIHVQFNPATEGVIAGKMTITHNAPGSPLLIYLSGIAVAAVAGVTPSDSALDLRKLLILSNYGRGEDGRE